MNQFELFVVTDATGRPGFLASVSFGLQAFIVFGTALSAVYPEYFVRRGGVLHRDGRPGLDVEIDETAVAKFAHDERFGEWTHVRLPHGSLVQP